MRQVEWQYEIQFRLNEAGDAFLVHAKRTAEERSGDDVYQAEATTRELLPFEINVLSTMSRYLQQKMLEENKSLQDWVEENNAQRAAAS